VAFFQQHIPRADMGADIRYLIYQFNADSEFEYFLSVEFEHISNFSKMSFTRVNERNIFVSNSILYIEGEDGYTCYFDYVPNLEFTDTYFGVQFDETKERFVLNIQGEEDHVFELDAFGYGKGSIFALDDSRLYSKVINDDGVNLGVYLSFSEDMSDTSFRFHAAEGFNDELYGYHYVGDEVVFYNVDQESPAFIEIYDENHEKLLRHETTGSFGVFNNVLVSHTPNTTSITPLDDMFTYTFSTMNIFMFHTIFAFLLAVKI